MSQVIKLILVGDGGVGKTTFLTKLTTEIFDPKYNATWGYKYAEFVWNGTCLQIWDVGGQPQFRGELPQGKFDMALVFVDLGSRITYLHYPNWVVNMDSVANVIEVVGNKSDLANRRLDANLFAGLKDNYLEFSCKTDPVDKLVNFVKEKCFTSSSE